MPKLTLILQLLFFIHQAGAGTLCSESCGGLPIRYPLGVDPGCGSPRLWGTFKCSPERQLLFHTNPGDYRIQSVDYLRRTMIVYDPSLSTCNSRTGIPSSDFFLLDTQYAAISPTSATYFVLFDCSDSSPLFHDLAYVCSGNISGGRTCGELLGECPGLSSSASSASRCCLTHYSTLHYRSIGNLMCSQYTVVYDVPEVGPPQEWPSGMKFSFSYPDMGCPDCLRSGGECGFDTTTFGFACLCADSVNTTTVCPSSAALFCPPPLVFLLLPLIFLLFSNSCF